MLVLSYKRFLPCYHGTDPLMVLCFYFAVVPHYNITYSLLRNNVSWIRGPCTEKVVSVFVYTGLWLCKQLLRPANRIKAIQIWGLPTKISRILRLHRLPQQRGVTTCYSAYCTVSSSSTARCPLVGETSHIMIKGIQWGNLPQSLRLAGWQTYWWLQFWY